jgi:hypothetical protein
LVEERPLIRTFNRWFLLRVAEDGALSLVNREGFETHEALRRAVFEQEAQAGDLFIELQGWRMEYAEEKS